MMIEVKNEFLKPQYQQKRDWKSDHFKFIDIQ